MAFTPRTHENGKICCSDQRYLCDLCRMHFGRLSIQEDTTMRDDQYGPYTRDVRALQAASSTPESRAGDEYRTARLRDLAAQDRDVTTLRAAHAAREVLPTDLARFTPPNPYERDIKALQAERR
jgi:hypothetical protein